MVSTYTRILQQFLSWGRQVANPAPAAAESAPRPKPAAVGPDRLSLSTEARQQMLAKPPAAVARQQPSATAQPTATSRKGSLIDLQA